MTKTQDADAILRHASPLVHQKGHETQPLWSPHSAADRVGGVSVQGECREPESATRRHHHVARSVQEASLAGCWSDLLPTPPPLRQALRGAEQTCRRNRGARPAPRWGEHRDGPRRGRDDLIPRPPKGRESVSVQVSRLLHAHEIILEETRAMARNAAQSDDQGTNDSPGQRRSPDQRIAGVVRRGARRGNAGRQSGVTPTAFYGLGAWR